MAFRTVFRCASRRVSSPDVGILRGGRGRLDFHSVALVAQGIERRFPVPKVARSIRVGGTTKNGGFTKLFQSFHETSCRPKENGREHKNDPLRSFGGVIFLCLNAVLGPISALAHGPLGHWLRPRCFEDQPVALVGLCRKRWRVGESVGASLVASAEIATARRSGWRRGLLREAPTGLRREQTNVGGDCGHDSRNGLRCPSTHNSHGGVAVALVAGRLHAVVARLNGVATGYCSRHSLVP